MIIEDLHKIISGCLSEEILEHDYCNLINDIMWYEKTGQTLTELDISFAARQGNINIVKCLMSIVGSYEDNFMDDAAESGNLELVKWVSKFLTRDRAVAVAISQRNMEIIKYFLDDAEDGIKDVWHYAFYNGFTDILNYAFEKKYLSSRIELSIQPMSEKLNTAIKWMISKGYRIRDEMIFDAKYVILTK